MEVVLQANQTHINIFNNSIIHTLLYRSRRSFSVGNFYDHGIRPFRVIIDSLGTHRGDMQAVFVLCPGRVWIKVCLLLEDPARLPDYLNFALVGRANAL